MDSGIRNSMKVKWYLEIIILPGGLFLFLLFLLVAHILQLTGSGSLWGVSLAAKPAFSVEGVMDGTYQNDWSKWLNDNFYLHTMAVKCHNQIQYSLFHDGNGIWEIGKDQMIYDKDLAYIYAAGEKASLLDQTEVDEYGKGISTMSQEQYDEYAAKVFQFQTKLKEYGKDFIYLLTPLKVDIYPESLSWYDRIIASRYAEKGETNRNRMIKAFKKYGVNYYDMTDDIKRLRQTADYEVFAKTGFHWTLTAVAEEMNTLFQNIQPMTPHITYPIITVIGLKDQMYSTDKDIYTNENVFWGTLSHEYNSPIIEYSECSRNKVYYFGTSMGTVIADAMAIDEKYRAFEDLVFQQYFNYSLDADIAGKRINTYTKNDPASIVKAMTGISDSDLIIMEHTSICGVYDTHIRFLDYVNANVDYLYYKLGDNLILYTEYMPGITVNGFYPMESWGRWSGRDASVIIYGNAMDETNADLQILMTMYSYSAEQSVKVTINGEQVAILQVAPQEYADYIVEIPARLVQADENTIELHMMNEIFSPQEFDNPTDKRYLGVAVSNMSVEVR